MGSIYEPIGGQSAIEAAVQRFHARVMSDPELAGQFDGMDMRKIMAHQVTLLGLFFEAAPSAAGAD